MRNEREPSFPLIPPLWYFHVKNLSDRMRYVSAKELD